MTSYRCTSCNYKYEAKGPRVPILCPACGKNTIDKEMNASEILDTFGNSL